MNGALLLFPLYAALRRHSADRGSFTKNETYVGSIASVYLVVLNYVKWKMISKATNSVPCTQ
jgi:hypothetical protein